MRTQPQSTDAPLSHLQETEGVRVGAPHGLGRTGYRPYLGGLLLRDPAQAAVELQVLPPCQQVRDGIKLGTVTHVLVDRLEVGEHTAGWGQDRDR